MAIIGVNIGEIQLYMSEPQSDPESDSVSRLCCLRACSLETGSG